MKKKFVTAAGILLVIILIIGYLLINTGVFNREKLSIKVVEKDSRIRLSKPNTYWIFGIVDKEKIQEKFFLESNTLSFKSNKELFNTMLKDSTYQVEVYGLNTFLLTRTISEVLK